MKLRDWYRQRHGRLSDLARAVGVSLQYIDAIAKGDRQGKPAVIGRISAATGGEVTVQELLFPNGLPEGARMVPGCACNLDTDTAG
jgi:DNA-binding transcriptional regulator YdaS (Cro superfamily)